MPKIKFYDVKLRKAVMVDDTDIKYRKTKNGRFQLVANLGDHCAFQMASEETAKKYPKYTGPFSKCATKKSPSKKKSPAKKSPTKKSPSKKKSPTKKSPSKKKSPAKKSPSKKKSPCKKTQSRSRVTGRCKTTIAAKRAKCKKQGKVLSSTSGRCKKR